jgi:hypothetical protein
VCRGRLLVRVMKEVSRLAENKTYLAVNDLLGIRIECTCGVVLEGKISAFEEKSALLRVCPGCSKRWTSGKENDLAVSNSVTSVMIFLNALSTFKKDMAQSQGLRVSLEITSPATVTAARTA